MKPRPQSPARSGASRRGFLLFEVMLAMMIFCLVVVGLARGLSETSASMLASNRETQVRLGLQSRLAENELLPVQLGKQSDLPDDTGITYEHEWRQLTLQNATGTAVPNMYQLFERASWNQEGQAMNEEASLYIYQPPQ